MDLIVRLARAGSKIDLIAVTRGEASHPRSRKCSPLQIAKMRQLERADALTALSLGNVRIVELGLPDGHVADVSELVDRLTPLVRGATYCVAPWSHDGHPDHDASGVAAALACEKTDTHLVEYLIWGWHWAAPKTADFPWYRIRKVSLREDEHAAKMRAIAAYQSQIKPLAPDEPEVILPPRILERFQRTFEVVLA
ncbi:MAG: PIG-L family deacetylase [Polyangiaceae bacterium]